MDSASPSNTAKDALAQRVSNALKAKITEKGEPPQGRKFLWQYKNNMLKNGRIFQGLPLRCYTGTDPLPDVFGWSKEDIEDVELALSERNFICLRHVKDPSDSISTADHSTPSISGDEASTHSMDDQGVGIHRNISSMTTSNAKTPCTDTPTPSISDIKTNAHLLYQSAETETILKQMEDLLKREYSLHVQQNEARATQKYNPLPFKEFLMKSLLTKLTASQWSDREEAMSRSLSDKDSYWKIRIEEYKKQLELASSQRLDFEKSTQTKFDNLKEDYDHLFQEERGRLRTEQRRNREAKDFYGRQVEALLTQISDLKEKHNMEIAATQDIVQSLQHQLETAKKQLLSEHPPNVGITDWVKALIDAGLVLISQLQLKFTGAPEGKEDSTQESPRLDQQSQESPHNIPPENQISTSENQPPTNFSENVQLPNAPRGLKRKADNEQPSQPSLRLRSATSTIEVKVLEPKTPSEMNIPQRGRGRLPVKHLPAIQPRHSI